MFPSDVIRKQSTTAAVELIADAVCELDCLLIEAAIIHTIPQHEIVAIMSMKETYDNSIMTMLTNHEMMTQLFSE